MYFKGKIKRLLFGEKFLIQVFQILQNKGFV